MPSSSQTADRPAARRAFTLTELMVVMVIVGVMAAMSVPSFQRAIEQSRADIAVANLRAIWAAERLYWLEYHTYAANVTTLQTLGVLDNGIPNNPAGKMGGYQYNIPTASDTSLTATATRSGNFGAYSINEIGDVSGTVTIGGTTLTPGFQ